MVKRKYKFGDMLYIEWIDACSREGWRNVQTALDIPDEVLCFSSAFYIGENKFFITIAHTIGVSDKNDINGIIHIPIAWIKKIKKIKLN